MNSILNAVKKEAAPPKKLQQKKQRVVKIACDLVGECICLLYTSDAADE